MKKILLIMMCSCIIILSNFSCSVENDNSDPKEFLCGNWYKNSEAPYATEQRYSWGNGKTVSNFTLEIDLYGDNPTVNLPMIGGPFPITEVKNIDKNTIYFVFFFDRGNFNVSYHVHKLDNGAIWFEFIKGEAEDLIPNFYDNGRKFLWYKIDGPKLK